MDLDLHEALTEGFAPEPPHRPVAERLAGAVLLRHWLGLSVTETADMLGVSEGTVKSHTSRGLTALEKALLAADNH